MRTLLSGAYTLEDGRLYDMMRALMECESIFIEPSACACLPAPSLLAGAPGMEAYLAAHGISAHMENATHVLWATGGRLVPEAVREEYRNTYLR